MSLVEVLVCSITTQSMKARYSNNIRSLILSSLLTARIITGNVYGNMPAAVSGQALVPDQNIYTNMHAALSGLTLAPSLTSTQHDNPKVETDIGSEAFGGASLRHAAYLKQGKSGNTSMPMNEPNMNAMIGHQANGAMIFQLPDGTFMYAGSNGAQGNYHQYPSQYNLPLTQTSQYQQAAYNGMHSVGVLNNPHTPRNHPWIHHQGMSQVPDLVAPRRTSWSSTEELSPQTPVDGYQPTVFLSGYSPSTWNTTPSPTSVQHPYNHQIARKPNGDFVIADFQLWTQEHPAIPAPVPAWASGPDGGRGSLDKILHNPDETTNVYVRGLRPDTTDEMLAGYGSRFGAIVSQKAIVDMANNNSCKG